MACCGNRRTSAVRTFIVSPPAECEKSIDYYNNLLVQVTTELKQHELYSVFISTIKSQINIYNKNCNKYESYIETYILPLLTTSWKI